MIDTTPFDNFNDFFAWYITIIKAKVPDFMALDSGDIHKKMGSMSEEEFLWTAKNIRRLQQIPKGLALKNDNRAGTFYATWDKGNNRPIIAFPTVMMYWIKYPPIVKGIIQHELGHCVGEKPDILTDTKTFTDKDLINISMDVRINQNIDYEVLAQIYKCTFLFDNSFYEMKYVPEYWMPKECNLPASLKTKATWTWLYKSWQEWNPNEKVEEEIERLQVGDYVKTLVDKHGVSKGTIGIVSATRPHMKEIMYKVVEATPEEIEALKTDDYQFFQRISTTLVNGIAPTPTPRKVFGEYELKKDKKELKKIPIPVFNPNKPKIGDIALIIVDKPSIKKGVFGMVTDITGENEYKINEFGDEVQQAISNNDYNAYIELITEGESFTGNYEYCIYAKEFILKNLEPPPDDGGNPPPPPPPHKELDLPQIGDIVVIKKGDNFGKYGVITNVVDGKYTIEEVSEEIVRIKTGRKI